MEHVACPEEYERDNVHEVYEQIATHFSSTRYKVQACPVIQFRQTILTKAVQPWPVISAYVSSFPAGSLGIDVGCGNGKNLSINRNVHFIASDRSESLVKLAASNHPQDVAVADILDLPYPSGRFDFAICIAVVHHLSTHERRVAAIRAVLEPLKAPTANAANDRIGTALFFVWALEQKGSRRGWDAGDEQNVMVPWVLKSGASGNEPERVLNRYYHLYRKNELEESISEAGGKVVDSGYEKDNWWAIARREL
jgi:tRNA (uracil-5-)-methyltransferase TRM9